MCCGRSWDNGETEGDSLRMMHAPAPDIGAPSGAHGFFHHASDLNVLGTVVATAAAGPSVCGDAF